MEKNIINCHDLNYFFFYMEDTDCLINILLDCSEGLEGLLSGLNYQHFIKHYILRSEMFTN